MKGSGYISAQCCGSTEIELGKVYAAEKGVTLFSQMDRYTLEGAQVELSLFLLTQTVKIFHFTALAYNT